VLAATYARVNWRRVAGRKRSTHDIFAHRIKASAYQDTVPRFIEKLCHSLSLQSIPAEPETIEMLDQNREEVLEALRRETVYYTLLAAKEARGR